MLQTETNQKCVHCPNSFPRSKLHQHVLSQHADIKVKADLGDVSSSSDYGMDEGDMDLDEDDEDVKQFLQDIDNAHEEIDAICEDDTEFPDSEFINTENDDVNLVLSDHKEAEAELKNLVTCDICKQQIKSDTLEDHLAQNHDMINKTDYCCSQRKVQC